MIAAYSLVYLLPDQSRVRDNKQSLLSVSVRCALNSLNHGVIATTPCLVCTHDLFTLVGSSLYVPSDGWKHAYMLLGC
jgi:hypothetical protein